MHTFGQFIDYGGVLVFFWLFIGMFDLGGMRHNKTQIKNTKELVYC